MLRRNLIIICAALHLVVYTAMAQAQLPQITSGLSYLTSSQNPDGTWATTTAQAETTVTTITALETLKILNQTAGSAYTSATAWLLDQTPATVDYIAERIRALSLTDSSINTLFPSIDPKKGAWGGDEGYLTNNLDTVFALQALKAANYTDITTISAALGYLTTTQNPDGGWGFVSGVESSVYLTAIVSTTLQQFAQSYNLATTITKASAYLASWQNPDGGFGAASGTALSTTFETALAYIALVNDGQTQDLPLQRALNFLTSTQSLNGSWNDDPYSTALALKALYISENRPAPPPPVATTGSLMGTVIDDITKAPLAGVAVVLTGSSAFSITSDASGKFSLSGVPIGSQQITFTSAGYAPLTITATVSAGTIINLGTIGLSANPTSGVVQGIVWDAELNAPYPGVTMQAQSGGNTFEATSGADGSYKITNVPAGTITGGTKSGLKPGYLNVTFSGELPADGILIYNPRLAKVPAPSAALYLKTNQALYKKGDNVALTVDIRNNRTTDYPATLQLHIADPSGVSVYDTNVPVTLTAGALLTQSAGFTLPTTGPGGFYTVQAELYDANNVKLATVATNFGMVMSQIAVTPKLPAQFTQGANNVTFDLVNKGSIAISSGALAVTLKDPDGVVIATSSQPFSLTQGGSSALTYALSFPALKFGTYTLSYIQSDETTNGQAVSISLMNSISILPVFDKPSYQIRETAILTVEFKNTGIFNLESIPVTVSLLSTGYSDSKNITNTPGQNTLLTCAIPIPATVTAGTHDIAITAALPSGSKTDKHTPIIVPISSLTLSEPQTAYTAGETITLNLRNLGGIDTIEESTIGLYDARNVLVGTIAESGAITAGGERVIPLFIPVDAADGTYQVQVSVKDLTSGLYIYMFRNLTVTGVKATLSAVTNKSVFLNTETIDSITAISNQGTAINGSTLNLKVVPTEHVSYTDSWGQGNGWKGLRQRVDINSNPKNLQLEHLIINGDFEYGDLTGWTKSLFENGQVFVVVKGTRFSSFPTEQLLIHGNYAVNVRSDGPGSINSLGVMTSDPFVPADNTLNWVQLSERSSVYLEYRILDTNMNILKTAALPVITGAFGAQQIDISPYKGQTIRVEFRQHTNQAGSGWFTLLDDIRNGNAIYHPSGTFESESKDYGVPVELDTINWIATTPANTSARFQIATNMDNSTWNYLGPDGTSSTYYESSSGAINPVLNGNRYMRWKAYLAAGDTTVTPTLHSLTISAHETASRVLWENNQSVDIPLTTIRNLTSTVGSLNTDGKLYLLATLSNSIGQTFAESSYPFYILKGSTALLISSDKYVYKSGETVTITGEVKNLTLVDAANLTLTLKSTVSGSAAQTIYANTFSIPAGGSRPFTVTTTAGPEGVVTLTGTITQNNATLATMADQYEVANPKVTAALTAPDSAKTDPFALSLQLTNSGKTDATITIGKSFNAQPESLTVPAGQTRLLQYTQQITADTTYTFTLTGDLNLTLSKKVTFVVAPVTINLTTKVVTDKISYNPNEQATLTSTVSANSATENLSAWISVSNSQGQAIYSATTAIPILNQNQQISLKTYWSTGINPTGNYLVTLQILDSAGTVIGKTTCNLVINSSAKPTALLKGKITPDKQSILTGEIVTVSYSITNTGNIDLANIPLSIRTVNLAEQTVYNTIADQTTLATGTTSTNSGLIDTMNYSAKDYLVVLRATVGGVEETLAGSYFRVEGAPSAPALSGPASGTDVDTFTPQLSVSNAADPNDDKLTYEFEVYSDSGLTNLAISGTIPEMAGTTVWTVPVPLTENQTFYWRARAFDGRLYGPWMTPASFRVNTVNDLPTAPTVSSPADGTAVASLVPTLTINNSTDPDSPNLTCNFDLALDPDFTQIVASIKGVASGQGTTSWTMPADLQENGWYYWRAQADDWLMEGPWSATARFQVNTANDAPSAPAVSSPVSGASVATLEADIVVTNSSDLDSSSLLYYFEVDTVPTFDSTGIIRSDGITEGQGTTLWHLGGLLDNTRYYIRVKASDGSADSPWSNVTGFFANTANDAPSTPALANPSNGAGVSVFTPTLSVHNSTDQDKDILTYQFELYADAAMTNLIAQSGRIAEGTPTTGWTVPTALTENQTCYWRARATDGSLYSSWMPTASFMVNTANDAPGAPILLAPGDGTTLAILTPTLEVVNALDPDSTGLTCEFEVYSNNILIASVTGVPENISGKTSVTFNNALSDNMSYTWRVRAFDGDRYGTWMNTATFKTHVAQAAISTDIKFDPATLNRKSEGNWVKVDIGLPSGYRAADVDISSIRFEGAIPAEASPISIVHKGNTDTLSVKFLRSAVIAVLTAGEQVPVHVTGKVGATLFEGVDIIRMIK